MKKGGIYALIGFLLGALFSLPPIFAEDWDLPSLTSNYTDVLSILKDRDVTAATMDYTTATDFPTGVIRYNRTSDKLEEWDGDSWEDAQPDLWAHLTDTSNPHSVTAAQVGAPTTGSFNAHTTNTSNPHSVTTGQIGALAASNNLSDVTNAATARTNLAAASSASLTSHTGNTSNPHSVTAAQVGALAAANNLSDLTNTTTARINLGAAESGANATITSMTGVSSVRAGAGDLSLRGNGAGTGVRIYGQESTYIVRFAPNGQIVPQIIRPDYTPWPSGSGGYTTIRSINPAVATAADCANAINTIYADLIALGLWQ